MFKLLGPLSKSIRQNSIGYSFVLKERTIFQFKNFSFECTSVELSKNYVLLLNDKDIKKIFIDDLESLKIFTL